MQEDIFNSIPKGLSSMRNPGDVQRVINGECYDTDIGIDRTS